MNNMNKKYKLMLLLIFISLTLTFVSCAENTPVLIRIESPVVSVQSSSSPDTTPTAEIKTTPAFTDFPNSTIPPTPTPLGLVFLDVPLISQFPELPAGCEITAVTIMLQYSGADVNKNDLAKEMPRHESNTNKGFVGDPFKPYGTINTIMPSALMKLVSKYAGSSINMTGNNINALKSQIDAGIPVVTWITVSEPNGLHCVCVNGYDDKNIYYIDPKDGQQKIVPNSKFSEQWNLQKRRAISYKTAS